MATYVLTYVAIFLLLFHVQFQKKQSNIKVRSCQKNAYKKQNTIKVVPKGCLNECSLKECWNEKLRSWNRKEVRIKDGKQPFDIWQRWEVNKDPTARNWEERTRRVKNGGLLTKSRFSAEDLPTCLCPLFPKQWWLKRILEWQPSNGIQKRRLAWRWKTTIPNTMEIQCI